MTRNFGCFSWDFYWVYHKNYAVQRDLRGKVYYGWSLVMLSMLSRLAGLNHLGPNTQGPYMSYIHLTSSHTVRWLQNGSKEVHLWYFFAPSISFSTALIHPFTSHFVDNMSVFFPHLLTFKDWSSRKTQSHPSFPKEVGEWQLCKSKVQGDPVHRLGIHGCRRRNDALHPAACGLNFNH